MAINKLAVRDCFRLLQIFVFGFFVGMLLLCSTGFWGSISYSADFGANIQSGLMQQPGSEYYHFVKGVSLSAKPSRTDLGFKLSYWERPQFKSQNYIDQEFGLTASFQFIAKKGKNWSWGLGVGVGRVEGYVAEVDDQGERLKSSRFSLSGLYNEWAFSWFFGKISLNLSQGVMIGFGPKIETDAYVAWPYQTILISVGYIL